MQESFAPTGARVRWGRVALLAALALLAGVPVAESARQARPVRPVDTAPTPGPAVVELQAPIALPAESLPAIYGLDLTHAPIAPLRVAARPELVQPEVAKVGPVLKLFPPSNQPVEAPPADVVAKELSADSPESSTSPNGDEPGELKLEWRKPKRAGVENSFTLPLEVNQVAPDESEEPARIEKEAVKESQPAPKAVKSKATTERVKTPAETERPKNPPAETKKAETKKAETKNPAPAEVEEPQAPLEPLTRNQLFLRNKLRKVRSFYYRRPLNSGQHDAWEAMHGMLAYGLDSKIRKGGPTGEPITSIGWLCYNHPCKGKQLMRLNDAGEIRAQYGVGLQGHMGQFLAMLAQCNVDRNYPIRVEGKEFTINDLIESEQKTCYANTELTFKLIGLMHYLSSDSEWLNDRGETWSIERLIEEELKQPVRGAACGGTHRLGGLSLAVRKREARGEPLEGTWRKAAQFTQQYENYAFRLQNPDGSFSTEWFRGPGRESDINRRVRTSGHLLEWIIYQSEDEQLTSRRVVGGVNYLTNLLYQNTGNDWEAGPLCHALHALALYDQRVFEPHDTPEHLAAAPAEIPARSAPLTTTEDRSTSSRSSGGLFFGRGIFGGR